MTSSPVRSRTAAGPKRSRPAFAPARPTTTECITTSGGSADCLSDPASRKAPASESSAADSMGLNAPLVEGRSQRLARRQTLFQEQPSGRLPRFEGLQCRSRLTKKRETHAIPVPPMPKIAIFCSLTLFFASSEHRSSFPRISMQASGERQSAASTGRTHECTRPNPSAGQGMIPASQGSSTHEDPANSNEPLH